MRTFVMGSHIRKNTILGNLVSVIKQRRNNTVLSDYYQKILCMNNIFCFKCGKEIKKGEKCVSRPGSIYCKIRWYHYSCMEAMYH